MRFLRTALIGFVFTLAFAVLASPGSVQLAQFAGTFIPVGTTVALVLGILDRKERDKRTQERLTPPEKQLASLSQRYGLPVETPLQKQEPLPPVAPQVHVSGMPASDGQLIARRNLLLTAAQLRDVADKWDALKNRSPVVLPLSTVAQVELNFQQLQKTLTGLEEQHAYVPAGQADLASDLTECLLSQVQEARATRWSAGRRREWRMNAEWRDEVAALKRPDGRPLWEPYRVVNDGDRHYLFGYPVTVSDDYGIPELTAL
jgi:hypothetical protein